MCSTIIIMVVATDYTITWPICVNVCQVKTVKSTTQAIKCEMECKILNYQKNGNHVSLKHQDKLIVYVFLQFLSPKP